MRKSEIQPRRFLAEDSGAPNYEANRRCDDDLGWKNGDRGSCRAKQMGERTGSNEIEPGGANEEANEGALHAECEDDLNINNTGMCFIII